MRTKLSMRLLKNALLRTPWIVARMVLMSAGKVELTVLTQLNLSHLRTVFDTVCETAQEVHEVVDDVVNCRTENVEMCKDVTNGFITEKKCELWPQEKCKVTQQAVQKYSPKVQCKKIPRDICTAGCAVLEVKESISKM